MKRKERRVPDTELLVLEVNRERVAVLVELRGDLERVEDGGNYDPHRVLRDVLARANSIRKKDKTSVSKRERTRERKGKRCTSDQSRMRYP